ncbi:MAG TPA: tetratricopeptide repeat protein [Thermoanaerobaculia bacterium]|nr:tetratricopeptide repeat protein [Thermoanaerobaculia bacterium]
MTQHSSVSPSSFNVTCPGCGVRLRFSVASEMPPRLRIQCSSCQTTFGVRRPGTAPGEPSTAGSIGETPPTYLAFPAHPASTTGESVLRTATASARPRRVDEPAFAPETTIAGRYRVVRFIARGGMGEVYEVDDLELRERVALKTVRPEVARDNVAVERFRREIQLARKVTHPNVCRIFDVSYHRDAGTGEGFIFLTMELLTGESLAERLRRSGPMSAEEALPIARQIAEGLHAAHQVGVVHRDLKPGNVMLVESRGATRAVVTDFGLARLEAGGEAAAEHGLTLTAAAAVVGTPAYLAPEQVEGSEITAATDIYALGIVLYEMLTGRVPFLADNALSTAVKRLREAPTPPRVHAPGLDPRWESAILRCLEREPAARFVSAPEILQAITNPSHTEVFLRPSAALPPPETVPAAEPPREPRPTKRRLLQLAVLAALILIGAAVGFYRYGQWRAAQAAAPGRRLALPDIADMTPRRSVAVLGFKDLSGQAGTAWLSSALAEMLSAELASGGGVRVITGENVARARMELGLGAADSLARDTLGRLRTLLGTDAVVLGSYVVLNGAADRQIRLDLRLQDTVAGETTATVTETGSEGQLFDLVSRVGKRLRRELGVEEIADGEVRAALPASPEAARLYAEGLERLRLFDPAGARDRLSRAVAAEPGNALCHSALAAAWFALGYDGKAREEAKTALDLAAGLPREERLLIEGRYREVTQNWPRAIQIYWTLWSMFPDSLDHGLRLAAAQTAAGQVQDALVTAEALRTLPAPSRDDPRIDLAEATAAGARADFNRQRSAAAKAAAKSQAQGAPLMVAQASLLECQALRNLGQPGPALAACEKGRKLHATAGNRAGVAEALTHAANVLYDRGDLIGATRLYEQALGTYREIGNRGAEAGALNNIAVVLKNQGNLDRAKELYDEVLAISREIGSRGGEAYALNNLAGVLLRRGELDEASRLLEDCLKIRREQQDRAGEASALDNLGVALRRKGDIAGARQRHEAALAIRRQIGQKIGEVASLTNLGGALLDQGELSAARRSFESSLALCRRTDNKSGSAHALFGLGEVLAREGHTEDARKRLEEAIAIRTQLGEKGTLAESQLALAAVLLDAGDAVRAGDLSRSAAGVLGQQGATSNEALALAVSALAASGRGDATRAREAISRAMTLTERDQNLRARLTVEIAAARLHQVRDPAAVLQAVSQQASRAGLLELRLEADLALAGMQPVAERRTRLAALAQEARALGYGAIARKAGAT